MLAHTSRQPGSLLIFNVGKMKRTIAAVCLCVITLLGGCATARVTVTDEKNTPIAGAAVDPYSLSINYPRLITKKDGTVRIPWTIQRTERVSVSKDGYFPAIAVILQDRDVTRIVLKSTK